MMAKISVTLPTLYDRQLNIKHSDAKRKVICAGRRSGKTTLAAERGTDRAIDGEKILFASPSQKQVDQFWDKVKSWIQPLIDHNVVDKNEQKRVIKFPNGGAITCITASDPDMLRSDYADLIVLDEYAYMSHRVWTEVVQPMLLDTNGDAMIISTPNGVKSHFYRLFVKAGEDKSGVWERFRFPSHANPHLSKQALKLITEDMPEDEYKQEILAEFLEGQSALFKNLDDTIILDPSDYRSHDLNHKIIVGGDWGLRNDWTTISVGCSTCQKELQIERPLRTSYLDFIDLYVEISETWKPDGFYVEENAMGVPIIEQLEERGIQNLEPFSMQSKSKQRAIEGLRLAFEENEWRFIKNEIWRAELEALEKSKTRTGRPRYEAAEGFNDDTVIARALMLYGANNTYAGYIL